MSEKEKFKLAALKSNTSILLNKAHAKYICENIDKKRPSDDDIISMSLKNYLGVKIK